MLMNKEWSELNKTMQLQMKKKETFNEGIDTLINLRKKLMKQIFEFKRELTKDEFSAIPYINAEGYHSKTIAYSLYHIFRIEDIVVHVSIKKDTEIFIKNDYISKMNSPIITTGNELVKEEISEFSSQLILDQLYKYILDVDKSTTSVLRELTYEDLKTKMTEEDAKKLHSLKAVSEDDKANWLIDYWCKKNISGLIKMPLSRHWIMHIEASLRIKEKICKNKGRN